jgi:NifU-like protein involved in Fe-S cluster formation
VKACALGQASAALMGASIGRTRAAAGPRSRPRATPWRDMLKSGGPGPGAPFSGYEVLEPARDYRNRHASIMLSLEAAAEAMEKAERAACA